MPNPGGEARQVAKGLPAQALADCGGPGLVGMGEGVGMGWGGASNGAEDVGAEVGLVAAVVEPKAMDGLGGGEGEDVAPLGEGAGVSFGIMLPNQLREGISWNQVAKLLEDRQLRRS